MDNREKRNTENLAVKFPFVKFFREKYHAVIFIARYTERKRWMGCVSVFIRAVPCLKPVRRSSEVSGRLILNCGRVIQVFFHRRSIPSCKG